MRQISPATRIIAIGLSLGMIGLIAFPAIAPADAVYMKDGFTLHGKVRREATQIMDPGTGLMLTVFKGTNFFIMDDRVRWVIFNQANVENADPEVNIRSDFIDLGNPPPSGQVMKLPGSARLESITPFDAKWQRTVSLRNDMGKFAIKQRLTTLSPYSVRIESNSYQWNTFYLTKELGLDAVKKLLDTHVDLKEDDGKPDVEKRLKRFRFIMQGGWLLAAEEELDRAVKDLPTDDKNVTDRLERARAALRQAQVRDLWEEIQVAHRAGRYRYVRAILGRLPIDQLDSRVAVEAASLKAKYEVWDRQAKDLDRLLNVVNGRLVGPPAPLVANAETLIRADVGPDTLDRLEPFLTMAAQYEKELQAGKPATYASDDIFALAVTGWLMGRESAEPKVAVAERYWASREFLIAHQRTHDANGRNKLFDGYQRSQSPLSLDEVTQMISLSPPPEPAIPGPTVAPGVEERQTQVPWTQNKPVPYLLQLPPEYQPSRSYPVLIVLHGGGERPIEALARWSKEGARQGYILAAPDWGGAGGYNYTAEEHIVVTELIKDLRRRYAVDSDRVFLTGYGDGGTMAFDVGLSHPDLFAGVVPVCARPRKSTIAFYWKNAQYLPFYLLTGELAGDSVSLNRQPFENWMNHGYPSLMTIYKGRPMEPFLGEIPFIFDWMNRKRRATGFPELGRNPNALNGEEFQSMRAEDNRFYWVSIEQINDKNVNHEIGMKVGTPAALQASVRDNNSVFVNARGIKSLRLWFGRIWDAQSGWRPMVDFSKPMKITVNGRPWGREQTIQPSLRTMLDDLYLRGDRQRMFLAYVDVNKLP
jgi:pimeloyl-ACP methyl ester carboxylesterase